jgi:hypothetical protein
MVGSSFLKRKYHSCRETAHFVQKVHPLAGVPNCGKSSLRAFLQYRSPQCDAACDSFAAVFAASEKGCGV